MSVKFIVNTYYKLPMTLQTYFRVHADIYQLVNCGNLKVPSIDPFSRDYIAFEDDYEDNISDLNSKINENTAIYLAWKNPELFGDADFVGHQHYRRFFEIKSLYDINNYDMIVGNPIAMRFNKSALTGRPYPEIVDTTVKDGYDICHKIEDWNKMEALVKETKYGEVFDEWSKQSTLFAPCMCFAMRKSLFREWCEFAFPIIFKLLEQVDTTGYDNYQKRQVCFLVERMFSLFAWFQKSKGKKIKQAKLLFKEDARPSTAKDNRGQFE